MDGGDWICQFCGEHQLTRCDKCNNCGLPPPDSARSDMNGNINFSARPNPASIIDTSRTNGASWIPVNTPLLAGTPELEEAKKKFAFMSSGDWLCPGCGDHQFKRNSNCRKCGTPNPGGRGGVGLSSGAGATVRGSHSGMAGQSAGSSLMPNPLFGSMPGAWQSQLSPGGSSSSGFPNDLSSMTVLGAFAAGMNGTSLHGDPFGNLNSNLGLLEGKGAADMLKAMTVPGDNSSADGSEWKVSSHWQASGQWQGGRQNQVWQGGKGKSAEGGKGKSAEPGDWHCPSCGDLQFKRNENCRKCGTPNPTPPSARPCKWCSKGICWQHPDQSRAALTMPALTMDTLLAQPGTMADSSNMSELKKKYKFMEDGDWLCPSCGDHQFKRNFHCRKCLTPNPAGNTAPAPSIRFSPYGPLGSASASGLVLDPALIASGQIGKTNESFGSGAAVASGLVLDPALVALGQISSTSLTGFRELL